MFCSYLFHTFAFTFQDLSYQPSAFPASPSKAISKEEHKGIYRFELFIDPHFEVLILICWYIYG